MLFLGDRAVGRLQGVSRHAQACGGDGMPTGRRCESVHVTRRLARKQSADREDRQNGDIASIYDKDAKHELLRAPVMLEMRDDPSRTWPAWEVLYDDRASARARVVSRIRP